MTRPFVFVVILGLACAPAAAEDSFTITAPDEIQPAPLELLEINATRTAEASLAETGDQQDDLSFVVDDPISLNGGQSGLDEELDIDGYHACGCDDLNCPDVCGDCFSQGAWRFGWWGVSSDGSPNKTGEFQDLESSPFWDIDFLSSDGTRTWDVIMTGLDNEANDAHIKHFRPGFSADVQFQRYLRRWDHDPLTGFDLNGPVPPGPNDNVVSEDLNVGEDYAIRVQELDARFQGKVSNHLHWRLKVWGLRKFGERQTNATAHCFNAGGAAGDTCHVVSQRQRIDWVTMEVEPALEARFDDVTVEYSRTMRSFGQGDGTVSRQYSRFGFSSANGVLGPEYDYAIVPDNFTQIDRVKASAQLNECNHVYANLYHGNTENKFRDTHRQFSGFDLRLTNTSLCRVKLVGYANLHDENNELPPFFLDAPPLAPANNYDQDSLRHPVDYNRFRAGLKGTWKPFYDPCSCGYGLRDGLSIVTGYEYYQLARDFATYNVTPARFTQPDTIAHQFQFEPSTRWSPCLDTYVRYKVRFIEDPLIGVSEYSDDDPDVRGTFNSKLPEQEHTVEIGGTWTPSTCFSATAQFCVINSWHDSFFADFDEDSYPLMCSLWYAPTCRLSLTGAYGYFSNWIDQDITLGANRGDPTETETTRWAYTGESHLATVNASYVVSDCLQLVCGYEFVRGSNTFAVPPSPVGADWSLLPFLSDVVVETQRLTAGVDWQARAHLDTYVRYIYFDYDDISSGLNSGTAHMVLAGFTLMH